MNKSVSYYEIYKFNSVKKGGFSYNIEQNYPNLMQNGQGCEYSNEENISYGSGFKDLPSFMFFTPDYFLSQENEWQLVKNECNDEFKLDDNKILNFKHVSKDDFYLSFDISINWTQSVIFNKNFNLKIKNVDLDCFNTQLASFKYSNYFYINGSIENQKDSVFIERDFLKKNSSFDFTGNILFFHDVFRSEKISFSFKKLDSAKKLKRKKVSIRLPYKNVLDVWKEDGVYVKKDVVYYNDKFYIYIENDNKDDNKKISPDKNFCCQLYEWVFDSFLNSSEGKKTIDLLNSALNPFVEKFLGNEIILNFADITNLPKLNDFFIFKLKKYRITEIVKKIINGRNFLTVKGVEILNFKPVNFNLTELATRCFHYDISIKEIIGKKFLSVDYPSNESSEYQASFTVEKESFGGKK